MPYIKQDKRDQLTQWLNNCDTLGMLGRGLSDVGELNYVISCIIRGYMAEHGLKYQTLNDIVGALENVKVEFLRRVVAKFEDQKISDNGDVY